MPTLLFGSISTLADTSEEQRVAFNEAFSQHGLGWQWDREEYQQLLISNGGAARIADYAARRGEDVDAAAVHATKSEVFQRRLKTVAPRPRPGVTDAITAAHQNGWRIGLVTTTSPANVSSLLDALGSAFAPERFDVIVDASSVEEPKPSPAAYEYALGQLGVEAGEAVAVEDNVGGTQSAVAAGITCVAFPNENTVAHDFGAVAVTHHLEFDELKAAVFDQ